MKTQEIIINDNNMFLYKSITHAQNTNNINDNNEIKQLAFNNLFIGLPDDIKRLILPYVISQHIQQLPLLNDIINYPYGSKLDYYTMVVDTSHDNIQGFILTVENIYNSLWGILTHIQKYINHSGVKKWKYYKVLTYAINAHTNDNKSFNNLDWEQSFVLYFWMCIYH